MKMLVSFLVSVCMLIPISTRAEESPYGYSIERPIPGDITTQRDYMRYQKARKLSLFTSIGLGIASYAAIQYSSKLERKANRMKTTSDIPIISFGHPPYYPGQQDRIEAQSKVRARASGAKTAAIGLGLGALFAIAVNISLRF